MKNRIIICWIIYLTITPWICFAGSDPVSWRLMPTSGFPTTDIGSQSVVTYTLTSHLHGPAVMVTSMQINGSGITVEDGCKNTSLKPNGYCTITLRYSPTAVGKTTFQLTYGYNNDRIPLPQLTAKATGRQPGYSLSGAIPNFPSTISPTSTVPFAAVFINTGRSGLTNCFAGDTHGNNIFKLDPANAAHLTITHNKCGTLHDPISLNSQGQPLSSCTISGTLTAPYQTGDFTLSALMHCAQASSEPSVSSTVTESSAALTGVFSQPSPFPSSYDDNAAPFVTATFKNTGNVTLTNCRASTATGFSLVPSNAADIITTSQMSTCGSLGTPTHLNPTDSCYLYGQLTHLQVNPHVLLNATVICDEATASPQESFSIQSATGSCTNALIQPVLLLPTNTYKYADNVVQFKVTNECAPGQPALTLGTVSIAPTTGTATVTRSDTYDQCSNQTLISGASCLVSASVIPKSVGGLTVTASVTPVGGLITTTTTTATVATNQQPTHHIVFVNQCKFDVWYGVSNGPGTNCPGPNCKSSDPNLINNPNGAPTSAYLVPAQVPGEAPSTIDLSVSSYQNGAFWPRTGCTLNSDNQFICATGTCSSMTNSGTCNSSGTLVQPQSPYTKFEATLNPAAGTDGVYDVSAVNGMTVPVEVKAFGPMTGNTATTVYNCGAAGALMQPAAHSALGNCSWNYNPSSTLPGSNTNNDFYWVTPGADDSCTTSSLPNLCGMAWGTGPDSIGDYSTPINRRLGAFLGYNMLDAYAAYTVQGTNNATWGSVNIFTKYGLDIQLPGQSQNNCVYGTIPNEVIFPNNSCLSYYALISCPVVSSTNAFNSCYQKPANNDFAYCCGCVNWSNTLPSAACGSLSQGQYTSGMNVDWTASTGISIPAPVGQYSPEQAITWIKDACPTAYAYTYDDPSSSFQCNMDGSTDLNTSYQVTFCPGGVDGLPDGATDGRSTPPN